MLAAMATGVLPATHLTLHTEFAVGAVDPRLFGGFIEHIGRCVYEGVFDPESPVADEHGYRADVLEALGRLNMTAMRYPGGNFASGYHWQDGVGPRESRPSLREPAWRSVETNQFGTDEYIRLCGAMGWTPMITVNLGTGTPEEAGAWLQYCNADPGTRYADMRAANGHQEPYGVKLWCLGNEMDGPWQLGHRPARESGIASQQTAKLMKDLDPSVEVVVAGSCGTGMSSYIAWDWEMLERVGDHADYLSLHRYVGNPEGDTPNFLAVTNAIDAQIEEMDAVCRAAQARRKSKKRTFLCFDEWNVWYKASNLDGNWQVAPPINEEVYNLEDALVVAGFLNSFIRHADCVKIANLAQVVNIIAPLLTRGPELLVQSTFFPFEMMSKRRDGVSLAPVVSGPTYDSKTYGEAAFVDASAILSPSGEELSVFLTNRSTDSTAPVEVRLADRPLTALVSGELLTGNDPKAENSFDSPEVVVSRPLSGVSFEGGVAKLALPPLSFAAMTLRVG